MSGQNALQVRVQGDLEIVIERGFAAPPKLVYRTHTEPALIQRWLTGPPGWSMPVCELELKPGGRLLYVLAGPNKAKMTMAGVVEEARSGERLALRQTFEPAWYPGDEYITSLFQARDGGTLVKTTVRYQSKEARDMVFKSQMAQGMEMTNRGLDALLTELQAG